MRPSIARDNTMSVVHNTTKTYQWHTFSIFRVCGANGANEPTGLQCFQIPNTELCFVLRILDSLREAAKGSAELSCDLNYLNLRPAIGIHLALNAELMPTTAHLVEDQPIFLPGSHRMSLSTL